MTLYAFLARPSWSLRIGYSSCTHLSEIHVWKPKQTHWQTMLFHKLFLLFNGIGTNAYHIDICCTKNAFLWAQQSTFSPLGYVSFAAWPHQPTHPETGMLPSCTRMYLHTLAQQICIVHLKRLTRLWIEEESRRTTGRARDKLVFLSVGIGQYKFRSSLTN